MIKTTGFDELEKKLQDITKKAEELNEVKRIPLSELFPEDFVMKHTRFSSISELFQKSGFIVKSDEDLAAIPEDKFDHFLRSNSEFDSWQTFLAAANEEWTVKRLGL